MKNGIAAVLSVALAGVAPTQFPIDASLPADARGRAIAEEAERRDEGFVDTVTELTMSLKNAEGRERTRRLTWKILESVSEKEGDRSLTVFHEPRDIEGTAFLSYTYIERDDDQWLFLPALKRVKRIASSNKSSAFVGSEFAYEDLLSDEVEKFEYLWIRDEACDDWQCYVIERRPRYANSGYSRQRVWIDQAEFRPVRIDYYDKRDRLQKTLVFEDYRLYFDRFWRAHMMRMDNHQTSKTTTLSFADFAFQTGLTERDFDPSVLRTLR